MTSEPDWYNNPWDHFDEQGKAIQQERDDGWSVWADGKYHHRVEVNGKIYVDGTRGEAMTPTQAQIDAVIEAMNEHSIGGELYHLEDYQEAAKAAWKIVEVTTIERCAQLAERAASNFPDTMRREIAAAIRDLKDKS